MIAGGNRYLGAPLSPLSAPETHRKTLVIACADPRCWKRANDLFEHYRAADGHAPYIMRVGGGSMVYALDSEREAQLEAIEVFLSVVDQVHLEDHDGGADQPGCAAYGYVYGRGGEALERGREHELHVKNLAKATRAIIEAARAKGRTIRVITQIDHLNGVIEPVSV